MLYVSWLTMRDLQLAQLIEVCQHWEFPEPCCPGREPCIWRCADTTSPGKKTGRDPTLDLESVVAGMSHSGITRRALIGD